MTSVSTGASPLSDATPTAARAFVSLFERDPISNFARVLKYAIDTADVAAHKQEVSDPHAANVIRRRNRRNRQLKPHFVQSLFYLHVRLLKNVAMIARSLCE
jgi:hypothetical protein